MGTSASNSGPKKNTELLPTWATNTGSSDIGQGDGDGGSNNNNPETEAPDSANTDNNHNEEVSGSTTSITDTTPVTTGNWGVAKGALSRYANGTGGSSLRKAANSYVKTLGGSSKATKA